MADAEAVGEEVLELAGALLGLVEGEVAAEADVGGESDAAAAHRPQVEVVHLLDAALAGEPGVEEVHHLHLWSMGSSGVALSAHVRLAGDLALHEAQERTREFEDLLADRFGIRHTTLQVECHDCEAPSH